MIDYLKLTCAKPDEQPTLYPMSACAYDLFAEAAMFGSPRIPGLHGIGRARCAAQLHCASCHDIESLEHIAFQTNQA